LTSGILTSDDASPSYSCQTAHCPTKPFSSFAISKLFFVREASSTQHFAPAAGNRDPGQTHVTAPPANQHIFRQSVDSPDPPHLIPLHREALTTPPPLTRVTLPAFPPPLVPRPYPHNTTSIRFFADTTSLPPDAIPPPPPVSFARPPPSRLRDCDPPHISRNGIDIVGWPKFLLPPLAGLNGLHVVTFHVGLTTPGSCRCHFPFIAGH